MLYKHTFFFIIWIIFLGVPIQCQTGERVWSYVTCQFATQSKRSVILVGKNQIQVQFLQPSAHAPHTFNRYAACRTNDELPEDRGFEILVYYSFATEREERATREP